MDVKKLALLLGCQLDHAGLAAGMQCRKDASTDAGTKVRMPHVRPLHGIGHAERNPSKGRGGHGWHAGRGADCGGPTSRNCTVGGVVGASVTATPMLPRSQLKVQRPRSAFST